MKSAFSNIDAANTPDVFVQDLANINRQLPIQDYKRRALRLLKVSTGQSVLDVGCGIGEDTKRLAESVGDSGRAVGIDKSSAMIAEAQRLFEHGQRNLSFQVCVAEQLPFPDHSFDRAIIDRTLQHVDDPLIVLHEVYRVLKPKARIVAIEPDWQTIIFDTSELEMCVRFAHFMADSFVNAGKVGRTLARLAQEVGFTENALMPVTTVLRTYDEAEVTFALEPALEAMVQDGLALETEVSRFRESLKASDNAKNFMASLTGFIYVGIKSITPRRH